MLHVVPTSGGSRLPWDRSASPTSIRLDRRHWEPMSPLPGGACDVGGDYVGGVPVQAAAGSVVPHRGSRVGMRGGLLDVAQFRAAASARPSTAARTTPAHRIRRSLPRGKPLVTSRWLATRACRLGRGGLGARRSHALAARLGGVGAKRCWQPVCFLGSPEARRCGSRGCSAAGSAPPWHGGGQGFESPQLHHNTLTRTIDRKNVR